MEVEHFQELEHQLIHSTMVMSVRSRNMASDSARCQAVKDVPDEMPSGHHGSHPTGHVAKC